MLVILGEARIVARATVGATPLLVALALAIESRNGVLANVGSQYPEPPAYSCADVVRQYAGGSRHNDQ